MAELGDVAEIERRTIQPTELQGSELLVGLENLTSDGGFTRVAPVSLGDVKSNKFAFDDGHLLYGKLRPYLSKIAVPSFAGLCSTDILPIRVGERLDRRFLFHYLRTPELVAKASDSAVGMNLPRLSPKVLASFMVPLPPMDDQRRIAAVLDAANSLREQRRQVLAKLNTLIHAIFIQMFASSGWNRWNSVSIADMAADEKGSIRTGPFGSQLLHEEFTDHGIAVLGIDNAVQNRFEWAERRYISEEKYAQLRRYTVQPGDVLVTIMGTCGRVAVVPEGIPTAINTKHLCCITLDQKRCLPEFLWASLRFHPGVLHQLGATRGAVMPGLNMGLIRQAEIPLPPIEEQVRFVARKAAAERQMKAVTGNAKVLDTLFHSLQQRAFRGEL